ncbi:MAG: glycosyltransferase [Parcubacteria group bacterium]
MPDRFGYGDKKINLVMFNMSTFFDWDESVYLGRHRFLDRFFDWSGGKVNRNYHILHGLAKDERIEKIIGVDFLPVGLRKAVGHYVKNILFEAKNVEIVYGDLTSACYRRSEKIYAYTTVDSLFSFKIVAAELRRIEKILNLKNIVLWSYNPMFTEYFGKLNEKLSVFDTVDNWAEHPSYTKLMSRNRLIENYKIISDKADLIFTVSSELKGFYENLDRFRGVHWVPNGVDFAHFNDAKKISVANELDKLKRPIIGYLGTIQERIDFDLIKKMALAHPDKTVALCGPVWPSVKKELIKFSNLKNIVFCGRIHYEDAPSYVNKFDVAIIPHRQDKFTDSMNPMKLYDYLACGKPVVAMKSAGADMFKNFIYTADNSDDFVKLIDQALREDSPEKREARRQEVKKHSWKKRTEEIAKLMFEKLNND